MRFPLAVLLFSIALAPVARPGPAARPGDVKPRPAAQLPRNDWFNTPGNKPLRIEDLRGKVVLVNFWTYG